MAAKQELVPLKVDDSQIIHFEAVDIGEKFEETNAAFKRVI